MGFQNHGTQLNVTRDVPTAVGTSEFAQKDSMNREIIMIRD